MSVDYDLVVVGGGAVGVAVARDVAHCDYRVLIVESEQKLGGVWAKNEYQNLKLQGTSYAYRCLSLAPAYQKHVADDRHYAMSQSEILTYIDAMADHPRITVKLNTTAANVSITQDSQEAQKLVTFDDGSSVVCRAVFYATGYTARHAGKPIVPISIQDVTNGTVVIHSSGLSRVEPLLSSSVNRKIYIVGGSKASLDILSLLNPGDNILWLHRGHHLFMNKQIFDEDSKSTKPQPYIKNLVFSFFFGLGKNQRFSLLETIWLKMGILLQPGNAPLSSARPLFHGGIFSPSTISHVSQFRQLLISDMQVNQAEGTLEFTPADGSARVIPEAGSLVILGTGQKVAGRGDDNYFSNVLPSRMGQRDGIFEFLPCSIQALSSAMYNTSLILDYLSRSSPSPYNDGHIAHEINSIVKHFKTLKKRDEWSLEMAYLNSLAIRIPSLIFPGVSGDLAMYYKFHTTGPDSYYGVDLDVKSTLAKFKEKPKSNGSIVTVGVVVAIITAAVAIFAARL